ncbi:MAG TPA: hypothetical protein DIS76_01425 [Rhodospirillaceae bacterium]|nr:hypothetical protein [Rhodospirillaceae bacterium]
MKKGGIGGANTKTGLHFETRASLETLLEAMPNYEIRKISGQAGEGVFYKGELVARSFKQHAFYKFLEEKGVNWKSIVSAKLLPDNALLVIVRDTLFIVEVKFQQIGGSVDEKLQTCLFKKLQYTKLVKDLGYMVEYIYVLDDAWFNKPKYKDVFDFITYAGCHYRFNTLPLAWLGLPQE